MAKLNQAAAGVDKLEALARMDSPVHKLHPMAKLITTFIYILAVLSFPRYELGALTPFILYPVIIITLSGVPINILLKRILVALPFSFIGGISNLFLLRGIYIRVGGFTITFGMLSFTSIMLKTLFCVAAVLILVSTTEFYDIMRQLRCLKVPEIICVQFAMTYRYITAVIDEAKSTYTAYTLRQSGNSGIRFKDMGTFLGRLILRGIDKAETVYHAMKCRGFTGTFNNGVYTRLNRWDLLYTISITACVLLLRIFNFSVFIEDILF